MDCLNRNDYDKTACFGYFQAYRECKKAWVGDLIAHAYSREEYIYVMIMHADAHCAVAVVVVVVQLEQRKADRRAGKDV